MEVILLLEILILAGATGKGFSSSLHAKKPKTNINKLIYLNMNLSVFYYSEKGLTHEM
jgi:type IV secretory pathway ATPase VirB11/archaellum biosynthesis ATPase